MKLDCVCTLYYAAFAVARSHTREIQRPKNVPREKLLLIRLEEQDIFTDGELSLRAYLAEDMTD
jgi:hypothetical protein